MVKCTCNTNTLTLAARKPHATFPDASIVSLGQPADKFLNLCGTSTFFHFGQIDRLFVFPERDVGGDGVVAQINGLRHVSNRPLPSQQCVFVNGHSVDANFA